MGAYLHPELDLLDLGRAVFALLLLFREFVFELPKIRDPADGWICRGSHLDEVETVRLGFLNCFLRSEDAELLACGTYDDTHFACANAVVDAYECGINGTSVRLAARDCDDGRAKRHGGR